MIASELLRRTNETQLCIEPALALLHTDSYKPHEIVSSIVEYYKLLNEETNPPLVVLWLRQAIINETIMPLILRWEQLQPGEPVRILQPLWVVFGHLLSSLQLGVVEGQYEYSIGGNCCHPEKIIRQFMTIGEGGKPEWRLGDQPTKRTFLQRMLGIGDDEFGSSCC